MIRRPQQMLSVRSLAVATVFALGAALLPQSAWAQSAAPADAAPGPESCVPFGTAQIPPGLPSGGGQLGLDLLPEYAGKSAPSRVELRTPTTQFNRFYEYTLVDDMMLARPRSSEQPRRHVPTPECLRGEIVAISVDDDEMVAIDDAGWIYTMDNASQDPIFWNWTSAWGASLWMGPGQQLPGSSPESAPDGVLDNTWALSVSSPWDNQTYTDIAGRIHYVGMAKMTMLPALTGDGSRITYADPWLANDDSYEIGGPLGGRFQSA